MPTKRSRKKKQLATVAVVGYRVAVTEITYS